MSDHFPKNDKVGGDKQVIVLGNGVWKVMVWFPAMAQW